MRWPVPSGILLGAWCGVMHVGRGGPDISVRGLGGSGGFGKEWLGALWTMDGLGRAVLGVCVM
jgi:hypothetical protein